MLLSFSLVHGLIFGGGVTGYLLLFMVSTSPRIWGYQDYPDRVKKKVPPQMRRERTLAGIYGVPFILFGLAFPVYSVLELRVGLGGAPLSSPVIMNDLPVVAVVGVLAVVAGVVTFQRFGGG